MSEEEDYDGEKEQEDEEEERADDDFETNWFMRDLSLHSYQYKPERKISSESSESSISDTIKIREREVAVRKDQIQQHDVYFHDVNQRKEEQIAYVFQEHQHL